MIVPLQRLAPIAGNIVLVAFTSLACVYLLALTHKERGDTSDLEAITRVLRGPFHNGDLLIGDGDTNPLVIAPLTCGSGLSCETGPGTLTLTVNGSGGGAVTDKLTTLITKEAGGAADKVKGSLGL